MGSSPKVLILGGGFAGVEISRRLEKLLSPEEATIQLVSRDNFVLFTPLLHEIASSDLDISTIANPIRRMLGRTQFIAAEVQEIDCDSKNVTIVHGFDRHSHVLTYDHLVLALGSVSNFHGMEGLEQRALTMTSLEDAILLRNRMIAHLEEADPDCSAGSRDELLTVVVAGGGFSGVETVAGINDFLESAIQSYSNLHPLQIRVVLVHAGAHLLPELGEQLGSYAEKILRKRGVEIRTNSRLSSITDTGVALDDGTLIRTSLVVWTAGSSPSPVVARLPFANRGGRINTSQMLQVETGQGLWAIGDCASIPDGNGGFHPPTAQHALRQARTAAHNIAASMRGHTLKPFSFKTIGQLAAIGRRTGVAQIFGRRFSGFVAWWMWRTIYLSKLPGLEKRVRVMLDWTLDLVFTKDTVQYTSFRAFRSFNQPSLSNELLALAHDPELHPPKKVWQDSNDPPSR